MYLQLIELRKLQDAPITFPPSCWSHTVNVIFHLGGLDIRSRCHVTSYYWTICEINRAMIYNVRFYVHMSLARHEALRHVILS